MSKIIPIEAAKPRVLTFGAAAPDMFANGYSPIPLSPATKQPILTGWSRLNTAGWDEDDLAREISHNAEAACGWAVGTHSLALDLDITDRVVARRAADLAVDILGDTPLIRIGNEPKSLLIYRTDGTIRSTKPHPVEIFSGTGQCAVFGWHEKAGLPYCWPRANILELSLASDEVPLVTRSQITTLMTKLDPLLHRLRRVDGDIYTSPSSPIPDVQQRLKTLLARGLSWRDAACRVLEGIEEGNRHTSLYVLVTSAHRHGIDEDSLITLFERRASDLLDDIDPRFIERILDSVYGKPAVESPAWADRILTRARRTVRRRETRRNGPRNKTKREYQ